MIMHDMKANLDCGHEASEWWKTPDGTKCDACFSKWEASKLGHKIIERCVRTNAYNEIMSYTEVMKRRHNPDYQIPPQLMLYVVAIFKGDKVEYKTFPDFDPMHKFVNSIKESCSIYRFISHMPRG